jgi:hypothetical protein
MAAMHVLGPPPEFTRIVLPGDEDEGPGSAQECLAQAMQWLDAARAMSIHEAAVAPTSVHVVSGK